MSIAHDTPAAFLDRDGTIIRDAAYVRDANALKLLPGAAEAIRCLNARGVAVIVVTNQSGIARGLVAPSDYERVRERLDAELAGHGARIDATYMCPHLPEITGACDCRKPGLGLYRQAIADHHLDPVRSLFTGDRWRDVAPAAAFGGTGILLELASTPADDRGEAARASVPTATSLSEAVGRFLATLPASSRGQ